MEKVLYERYIEKVNTLTESFPTYGNLTAKPSLLNTAGTPWKTGAEEIVREGHGASQVRRHQPVIVHGGPKKAHC